jgi:hypothetical protein
MWNGCYRTKHVDTGKSVQYSLVKKTRRIGGKEERSKEM